MNIQPGQYRIAENESETDANSILTELDKGESAITTTQERYISSTFDLILLALRSSKIGEQCEAIVRFPKLFEKYPFPILINSSFLKLAEFFQNG